MRNRYINIVLALVSLIVGGFLYILFRPTSVIGQAFNGFPFVQFIRSGIGHQINPFLKFYLSDGLWSFSLCCCLHAVHNPGIKGSIVCGLLVTALGLLWEVLQLCKLAPGTFDKLDIVMYLLGSILCIIINFRRDNNEEN